MKMLISTTLFLLLFLVSVFSQTNEKLVCPSIDVVSPSDQVISGESLTFTTNIKGVDMQKHGLVWSVDKGVIIQGQGTHTIIVSTDRLEDDFINATVKLEGIRGGCINRAEVYVLVTKPKPFVDPDYFSTVSDNEVRARIDALVVELENNKGAIGYVVNKGSADDIKYRNNLIKSHLKLRNFDSSRITFVNDGEQESIKTMFRVAPCSNGKIISPSNSVSPDVPILFSVQTEGLYYYSSLKFKWTSNKGKIVVGQGTDRIVVETEKLRDETLKVKVEIEGLPKGCESKFTESAIITGQLFYEPLDTIDDIRSEYLQARLDAIIAQYLNSSYSKLATLVFVNSGKPKAVIEREKIIKEHLRFRDFDVSRIIFQYKGGRGTASSTVWIFPEGTDLSRID